MGVWGAIANKMEASQETCFLGAKITQASIQIIKCYVPYIFDFLKAYIDREIGKEIALIYVGLGAISPRSKRNFKELNTSIPKGIDRSPDSKSSK